MEAITRLVSESLARHGFDRPLDYRRLHWSRWFRCESLHSLLSVPSKPGVFAIAEEVMELAPTHGGADAFVRPAEQSSAAASSKTTQATTTEAKTTEAKSSVEERPFRAASAASPETAALAAAEIRDRSPEPGRRMLAVTQFFEDDDMAFVLDRMLTRQNPMRARLLTGRYFVRFVTIEDPAQRVSICAALNQWIANSGEKISGIGSHFAMSPDLAAVTTRVGAGDPPATAGSANAHGATDAFVRPASEASSPTTVLAFPAPTSIPAAPHLDSGAATNIHCPQPLPSGF